MTDHPRETDGLPKDLWISTPGRDYRFQIDEDGTAVGAPEEVERKTLGRSYTDLIDAAERSSNGRVWIAWLPFGGEGDNPVRPSS